jgi:2-polyprenyl-3-methyl-5-hydroxy-6-metoxy-1,4-benzoquinol methylase
MSETNDISLQPAQFLVENIALLPTGRVLDVAMGHGRNALYLAKQGFEVEGVDLSSEAVENALEAAGTSGVELGARVADLEDDFQIDQAAYDVIVCFNYLHRPLIPQIKTGLRTGGMVVYETFIVDQAKFGKPNNPDHLLRHNELLDMFRDFRCLRYREGIMKTAKAVAAIVAEKVRT